MNTFPLLAVETIVSSTLVYIGLSNRHFLWITNSRSAAITLGIGSFLFCTASIGKFISTAPAHPLTICGYILGTIILASIISQLFKLKIPVIGNPQNALIIIGVCIVLKGIIAQFQNVLV